MSGVSNQCAQNAIVGRERKVIVRAAADEQGSAAAGGNESGTREGSNRGRKGLGAGGVKEATSKKPKINAGASRV